MSTELTKITNAELTYELSKQGFYVNKISNSNNNTDIDSLVVSVKPPQEVEVIGRNANQVCRL